MTKMKLIVVVGLIAYLTIISQSAPIDEDLAPFGKRPSGSYSNDVGFDSASGLYSFYHKVNGNTVTEYFLNTKSSILQKGQFEIGVVDTTRTKPAFITTGSGPNFSFSNVMYKPFEWETFLTSCTFTHALVGNVVQLNFTIVFNKSAAVYKYNVEFSIQGATITFMVNDPLENQGGRNWWGFFIGGTKDTPNPTPHRLPYLPDPVFSFEFNNKRYYASHYLDRSQSNGVKFTQYADVTSNSIAATHYTTHSLTYNLVAVPLGEVGYLTVSPNIKDVLPSPYITQEVSYLPDLTDRVFLDVWTVDCSPYRDSNVDAVRRWTSSTSETVNITSSLTYNGACGNGAVAYISVKKTVVAFVVLNNGDKNILLTASVNVAEGDAVDFHVYANGDMGCDGTSWYISIDSSVRKYVAATDFSGVQESNGWSYWQYTHLNDSFSPLTFYPDTNVWRGYVGNYPFVAATSMHPAIAVTKTTADFSCVQSFIEELTWYGLQRLSIVVHNWQRFGYDAKLPQHFPPNPARGGESDAVSMINSAKRLGHLIGLHENYVDMYPDSPGWNASQLAYTAGNSTRRAWFNKGTGVQSYLIAHDYQVEIAKTQQPTIAGYGVNAGYEDVDPGVEPGVYIDLGATAHYPHSYKQAVINKKNLWNNFRSSYKGPLYGEGREYPNVDDTVNTPGHYMPYYAGYVDGYESQIDGKMGSATMPEFALYINKNNQYNNGMGYIGRYINADDFDYTTTTLDTYWSDRYRAQQITYGHTGWLHFNYRWGRQTLADTLTEYHLTRGLQQIVFSSLVTSVTHYMNGNWYDLATYTASGGDLVNDVVKIELEDNTKVIVNNRQSRLWTQWPGSGLEYIRGVQFSHNFGYYMLDRAANSFSPFPWNGPGQMFSAPSNAFCQIRGYYLGSGTQCDPALVFAPKRQLTNLVISLITNFGSGTCGDKATLRIMRGLFDASKASVAAGALSEIFNYPFTNTTQVEFSIDTISSFGENEALFFWLDQLTSAGCDQIFLRVWARADYVASNDHPFTFTASDVNDIVLPPNGYVAWNSDTKYLSFSAKAFNGTAIATDYSTSKLSTFARTREGTLQSIQNIQTDGTIAFEPTSFGNEHLYFSDVTTVSKDSKLILQSDTKVYGRLFYINDSAFELMVKSLDQQDAPYLNADLTSVSVVYGGTSQQFLGGASKLEVDRLSFSSSDNTAVVEIDSTGLVLNVRTALGQAVTVAYNRPSPPSSNPSSSISIATKFSGTAALMLSAIVVAL